MLRHLAAQEHEYFLELISFLGKGEASCLAFAKVNKAIVVTDDKTARKQCVQMGLSVTGTVGILKASVLDGLLQADTAERGNLLYKIPPWSCRNLLECGLSRIKI